MAFIPAKKDLYVVYFYADWCVPCQEMKPIWKHKDIIEELKKYKDTKFKNTYRPFKVNTDKRLEIAQKWKVTTIPTIIIMDGKGKEYVRTKNSSLKQLKDFLKKGPAWKKLK